MSVYQASENVYDHFDKVCVIYEGRMAYYGPAALARQYFIDMGYQPANRQTTPDFLVAVTDPNARIAREGYEKRVPKTPDEFAEHYRESSIWQINQADMDAYLHESVGKPQRALAYMESAQAEHATTSNKKSAYVISIPMQTRAVVVRRFQILKGSVAGQITNVMTFMIQAIVAGTIFLRIPNTTATFFSRGSVLYLFVVLSLISTSYLLTLRLLQCRSVRCYEFHIRNPHLVRSPSPNSASSKGSDVPPIHRSCGYDSGRYPDHSCSPDGLLYCVVLPRRASSERRPILVSPSKVTHSEFIRSCFEGSVFFLLIFFIALIMKAYFRAIAAWFSEPTPAQSVAGVTLLSMSLYIGYNIPEPSMIGALRWITYINVCISSHSFLRETDHLFVFSAAEVCVRGDHDQRVQNT